jgi:hypothetical protein
MGARQSAYLEEDSMKTLRFAMLAPIVALASVLAPTEALAQEPKTQVEVLSAVIERIQQDVPSASRIAFEVRTGDPRMEGSEFDATRSNAVGERPGVEVASRGEVLVCVRVIAFNCELRGADILVSVWRVEGSGSEREVYVDTVEAMAGARGGLYSKRIVMTVNQRSDLEWVVTRSRTIAES